MGVPAVGRLRRLSEELEESGLVLPADGDLRTMMIEEIDHALRPVIHERRVISSGTVLAPRSDPATWAAGTPFSFPYLALGIVAALLCSIIMQPDLPMRQAATFTSGWTIASQICISWFIVVGGLLLLGYATKLSAFYSRRALFAWFLLTPAAITVATLLLRQWSGRLMLASGQARSAAANTSGHGFLSKAAAASSLSCARYSTTTAQRSCQSPG